MTDLFCQGGGTPLFYLGFESRTAEFYRGEKSESLCRIFNGK